MFTITLSDMKIGEKGQIATIKAEGSIRRRLIDMGLVKGTNFKIIRNAPLGDPIEIAVKGFNLSLRREEARKILVNHIGENQDVPMP